MLTETPMMDHIRSAPKAPVCRVCDDNLMSLREQREEWCHWCHLESTGDTEVNTDAAWQQFKTPLLR